MKSDNILEIILKMDSEQDIFNTCKINKQMYNTCKYSKQEITRHIMINIIGVRNKPDYIMEFIL